MLFLFFIEMVYHRTGVRGQEFSKDFFLLEYTILTGAQVAGRAEVCCMYCYFPFRWNVPRSAPRSVFRDPYCTYDFTVWIAEHRTRRGARNGRTCSNRTENNSR